MTTEHVSERSTPHSLQGAPSVLCGFAFKNLPEPSDRFGGVDAQAGMVSTVPLSFANGFKIRPVLNSTPKREFWAAATCFACSMRSFVLVGFSSGCTEAQS